MKKQNLVDISFAILLVLLSRLIYWIAAQIWNIIHDSNLNFYDLMCQWDSGWYRGIVENGYMLEPSAHEKGDAANWAFFPLYPIMVRAFSTITGVGTNKSGVLFSTILFIIAIFFAIKYVRLTRSDAHAVTIAILLAFGPYSFYFSSLYTESLFILLLVLCFYLIEKEKWVLSGLCGAFLSMTRPTGVMFFVICLIKMLFSVKQDSKGIWYPFKEILRQEQKILALLLIPSGLFGYMTYLYFHVGDPFAFSHVEIAWGRENGNPLMKLYEGLFILKDWGNKYLAIWGIMGLFFSTLLLKQRRYIEGLFGLISTLIPAMSSLQSLPRYLIGSFVVMLAFNDILYYYDKIKWPIIITLSSANVLLLFLWFAGHYIVT